MNQLILWGGNGAALLGIVLCALSGMTRVTGGFYTLAGAETGTVFMLGVGLMVFACLTKLHLLLEKN